MLRELLVAAGSMGYGGLCDATVLNAELGQKAAASDALHRLILTHHFMRPSSTSRRRFRSCVGTLGFGRRSARWGSRTLGRAGGSVLHSCRMSHTLTIRIDADLAAWLEEESRRTGVPQGKIVRDQLEQAKAGRGAQSFMRLAGAARGARNLSSRKGFSRG